MARRQETITIQDDGRDKGKVFILTEMLAIPGEKWATLACDLVMEAGVPVSEEQRDAGMEGLASVIGVSADEAALGVKAARALQDPRLEAWWDCVQYQHKPGQQPMAIDRGENCPIEEIKTVSFLRMQVLALHTAFFSPANASTSASPSPVVVQTGSRPTRISRHR